MLLVGINVGIDMVLILLVAVLVPQISSYAMCGIGLLVALATLVFQVHVDHTLIFTGQYLREDGKALYASIGIFGLGFGRKYHRSKKSVDSYRYHYIERVRDVAVKPYGIRVKAEVYTATSNEIDVDETIFDTPGALKTLLKEQGKKKNVVFRIEHNLEEREEKRLLRKLESLR
jgi:glycerophosphoryl diester phosphodiesterase